MHLVRVLSAAVALLTLLPRPSAADILVVKLDGVVHAVSANHVVRALDQDDRYKAPLLILEINTPGGLSESMRVIVDKILASRTPVAVFVGPSGARAASAGFVIAMAADVVAMAPGTNMGAAHPVLLGQTMDEVMNKKASEDAAAYVRGKAERRGRNVEAAEKAVLESKSYTEREAKDARLLDYIVKDVDELVKTLHGKTIKRFDGSETKLDLEGQSTVVLEMGWRDEVLATIANPEILFLLRMGALAGLGTEISHPGLIFPGVIGALCLVLFLFASQVVPVSAAGILLVLLAMGLFALEIKLPSYGLLTVGGIVAMILGALMLVDAPAPELQVPLRTVVPAALLMAAWATLILGLVLRAQRQPLTTGAEGMIGTEAVAVDDLSPSGWVIVRGERWRATAESPVKAGEKVKVAAVSGLTLSVRKES